GVYAYVTCFFSMEDGSVTTYYTIGGDFTEIEMINTSGDTWFGEIPTPPYETTVSYYIEGIDGTGQSTTAPENAPDSLYSFYVGVDLIPPTMTLVEGPPNTVNLFGPYGPFTITAWDMQGINQSEVIMYHQVNDEAESEIALSPTGGENEYGLDGLDLERQLNSGDIVHYYFTAVDEANDPNMSRLPENGTFELLMADAETFEGFEVTGIDRWITEGAWTLTDQYSHSGDYSMIFGSPYPDNADDLAYMDFGYDLSPYTAARITLYHKNLIRDGDTCFVMISGDGGQGWTPVGSITGIAGPAFLYNEFDISSALNPNDHDYRVGFRFVSDASDNWAGLFLDDIGWAIGPMTGVDEVVVELPVEISLSQNYPNPFNPQTNISFALPNDSHVSLYVYDLLGRRVVRLIDEKMNAGSYTITWDGRDAGGNETSSGIYFYRLSTEQGVRQEKMTLLR
ncbi:MAG: T9SS type A sorting domain-containing protein, partial [candidate division Zixibacteria bacterium]